MIYPRCFIILIRYLLKLKCFTENTLAAVMELIPGYPDRNTAFIGFFMTDIQYRNRGFGSKIISEACAFLKSSGCKKVRIF